MPSSSECKEQILKKRRKKYILKIKKKRKEVEELWEEDENQTSHGGEKSDVDVNVDEGEESSDDEEYSHLRVLRETRDRVLGRGRMEDWGSWSTNPRNVWQMSNIVVC